ncbi:MAG: hypothetical protein ACREMY_00220 [bacterium]
MSLEKTIATHEKSLGRSLTEARRVAGVTDSSAAYQTPAPDADAPQLPADYGSDGKFGPKVTPVGNHNEQRSGVNEIVRGE